MLSQPAHSAPASPGRARPARCRLTVLGVSLIALPSPSTLPDRGLRWAWRKQPESHCATCPGQGDTLSYPAVTHQQVVPPRARNGPFRLLVCVSLPLLQTSEVPLGRGHWLPNLPRQPAAKPAGMCRISFMFQPGRTLQARGQGRGRQSCPCPPRPPPRGSPRPLRHTRSPATSRLGQGFVGSWRAGVHRTRVPPT